MVGEDGALPLPWLDEPLRRGLAQRSHALLVHGPEGVGQFELALTLAQAWLCESTRDDGAQRATPCGACRSCRLVQAHSHPDLLVLVPEALREALGWAGAEAEEGGAEKTGKVKPSKEIKVEALRVAVDFAQTTSARGRGKVVVLHPAERMNRIAANTLLKTLEEPPGNARFVLSSSVPDALLPTIRSRCQALPLALPARAIALEWLEARGVTQAAVLLDACGGRPMQALQWAEAGIDATLWQRVPAALGRGEAAPFLDWPVPRLIETLQKLCHDAICVASGAPPRYFPAGSVRAGAGIAALIGWSRELQRIARHAEHPWSAGLLVESLVAAAHDTLSAPPRATRESLHLRG